MAAENTRYQKMAKEVKLELGRTAQWIPAKKVCGIPLNLKTVGAAIGVVVLSLLVIIIVCATQGNNECKLKKVTKTVECPIGKLAEAFGSSGEKVSQNLRVTYCVDCHGHQVDCPDFHAEMHQKFGDTEIDLTADASEDSDGNAKAKSSSKVTSGGETVKLDGELSADKHGNGGAKSHFEAGRNS